MRAEEDNPTSFKGVMGLAAGDRATPFPFDAFLVLGVLPGSPRLRLRDGEERSMTEVSVGRVKRIFGLTSFGDFGAFGDLGDVTSACVRTSSGHWKRRLGKLQ